MAQRSQHYLIENRGQWPQHVVASASVAGGKVFLEKNGLTYHLFDLAGLRGDHDVDQNQARIRGHVYRVSFIGAEESQIKSTLSATQESYSNYFLGNDPAKWAGGCQHHLEAELTALYPGIDLQMHGGGSFLKYDLVVRAGAEASLIRMQYTGQHKLSIEQERLIITTSVGEATEQKPLAWQIIDGEKRMVECHYQLRGNEVAFRLPKGYDHRHDLIIDPELIFSTYSGSTSDNFGYTATYDQYGQLYSGSSAFGQGYPTTIGAYQITHHGGDSSIEQGIDMALSKYSMNGVFMFWSTFLGGTGDELPHSIIVNDQDELIVYGSTGSADYPITAGALDNTFGGGGVAAPSGTGASFPNGSDIVVTHFNVAGDALVGSTYIGGNGNDGICDATALKYNYADEFRGEVSLDAAGNILIVSSTRSTNIATVNAIQSAPGGSQDALIAKLNQQLSAALWLTYYGGSGDDSGFSITDNALGEHYICGGSTSPSLIMGSGGIQNTLGGGADAYILKLTANGNVITNGTYWGSSAYDQAYFIEVDADGYVYIYGQTAATGSTMIQNATFGTPNSGNLIAKFSSDLSANIWSSVIGTGDGKPNLSPSAFLVDYCNRIYISGWGVNDATSNALNPGNHLHAMFNMPTSTDAYDNTCSTGDFYMAVFDENMTILEYGTFFGGNSSQEHVDGGTSRFDRKGVIYQSVCAGCGGFDDFPIYPSNAWSAANGSSCNNGVFKFDFQLPISVADFENLPNACSGNSIPFFNTSIGAETWHWDFGDSSTSEEENPSHIFTSAGTYTITLTITSSTSCNGSDSIERTIVITGPQNVNLESLVICPQPQSTLSVPSNEGTFSWSPADNLTNPNENTTNYTGMESQDFVVTQNNAGCFITYNLHVDVLQFATVPADTVLCEEAELSLSAGYSPSNAQIVWSDTNQWGFNSMLNEDSTDTDILVLVWVPMTYYVAIFSEGCRVTDQVNISFAYAQTAIQEDFTLCSGEVVELNVLNPSASFSYHWEPASAIIAGQNTTAILANIDETTTFSVASISADGCTASDSVTITTSNLSASAAVATASDYFIALGESTQLMATPIGYTYSWSPASSLSTASGSTPTATPSENTVYTLSISDAECTSTDTVEIRVLNITCGPPNIYVPNAFTPNADGKNEKLYVRGINLTEVHLAIFDRWGELVFETRSLNDGWDGTFKGKAVDPDVFVYYLEAVCAGGEEYFDKGNITVIR